MQYGKRHLTLAQQIEAQGGIGGTLLGRKLHADNPAVYWLVARWFYPMSWLTPVALAVGIALVHTARLRFQQK